MVGAIDLSKERGLSKEKAAAERRNAAAPSKTRLVGRKARLQALRRKLKAASDAAKAAAAAPLQDTTKRQGDAQEVASTTDEVAFPMLALVPGHELTTISVWPG